MNGNVILYDELEWMLKEVAITCFKLLPQQLLEGWRKARIADLQAKNQI
jgi:hypothetical protein